MNMEQHEKEQLLLKREHLKKKVAQASETLQAVKDEIEAGGFVNIIGQAQVEAIATSGKKALEDLAEANRQLGLLP